MPRRPVKLPPVPEVGDRPVILARIYPGYHEEAVELFQEDAENLATHGYFPIGQSYADGRYADRWVLFAALLVLIGIGVLILIYMAAVRPRGSLAVTYELRGVA